MSLITTRRTTRLGRFLGAPVVLLLGAASLAPPATAARGIVAEEVASSRTSDVEPSPHYRQAEAHASDIVDFTPGERVGVGYVPRTDDTWQVDGRSPRALPAGHATGGQMQAAKQDSTWAAGPPPGAEPEWRDDWIDLPSSPANGTAELTSVVGGTTGDVANAAPVSANGLRREIFGFLPYWELEDASTVLDWRTLSTVAYFSVGCTGTGSLLKRNPDGTASTGWAGWTSSRMTSIIDAAHEHRTRVVLTISCFAWSSAGASVQARLLGSATARATLARQAAAAVRDRGADGINLDFEPILPGYADEFTKLVRAIRYQLNAIAPGYQLTFDAMGTVGNQPIAEATAPGGADAVFIMGYDYRTEKTAVAGSISPLSGPAYDLTDTLAAYTALVSPSKLILGVPYYGRAWSTPTDDLHAKNISGDRYGSSADPTYAQAVDLALAHGRRYDGVEESPWTAYRRQACSPEHGCATTWRQLYYDDAKSLKLRYDLINRAGLRGAGIWALGYDESRPELRGALAAKFLSDRTPPVVGVNALPQRVRDEGFRVSWSAYDDSPIARYETQVSIDAGAWRPWFSGSATSAVYLGRHGHTYAFRIRATDIHGNVTPWYRTSLDHLGAPTRLTVGAFARVGTDGLRLRSGPSTDATVLTRLDLGDALRVLAGPVSAGGYQWFQVSGPVRQWGPVERMQVGGWVAASGNGAINASPRRPTYVTTVDAGITGLRVGAGGERVITPNDDGIQDRLRIDWVNRRAFDSMLLRIHRTDGTLVGVRAIPATALGAASYSWNGRLEGQVLPPGAYVVHLQGVDGGLVSSAPSASPVSPAQVLRFGLVLGPRASTSVRITPAATATRAASVTYALTFGAPIRGLGTSDLRWSGTAAGCRIGRPVGSGASWTVSVAGCSQGSLVLSLRADTVVDAVGNLGPATRAVAATVRIDRMAPVVRGVRTSLRSGLTLGSASATASLPTILSWQVTDGGGAGIVGYEVARSLDGGPFTVVASGVRSRSLSIGLPPGHTYRFEVRARDRAGNVGAWVMGSAIEPALVQDGDLAMIWRGAWSVAESSALSGGLDRYSGVTGAVVKYTFVGRGIAWVTRRGPDHGAVQIYLDGVLVGTVDTRASRPIYRFVGFSRTWAWSGSHTLKLVVVGTAGRPRVDLDAFAVLR